MVVVVEPAKAKAQSLGSRKPNICQAHHNTDIKFQLRLNRESSYWAPALLHVQGMVYEFCEAEKKLELGSN